MEFVVEEGCVEFGLSSHLQSSPCTSAENPLESFIPAGVAGKVVGAQSAERTLKAHPHYEGPLARAATAEDPSELLLRPHQALPPRFQAHRHEALPRPLPRQRARAGSGLRHVRARHARCRTDRWKRTRVPRKPRPSNVCAKNVSSSTYKDMAFDMRHCRNSGPERWPWSFLECVPMFASIGPTPVEIAGLRRTPGQCRPKLDETSSTSVALRAALARSRAHSANFVRLGVGLARLGPRWTECGPTSTNLGHVRLGIG